MCTSYFKFVGGYPWVDIWNVRDFEGVKLHVEGIQFLLTREKHYIHTKITTYYSGVLWSNRITEKDNISHLFTI